MMLEILRNRRSVRFFETTPVAPAQVDLLVEAVLRSPSSRGHQPWEYIVVSDPQLIEKLSRAKAQGSAFLARAPLLFVIAADTGKSDVWIEDCAIASIILQLAAESLGLGSCWAQIRNRAHNSSQSSDSYIKELLGLPQHFAVECIIGVGHPAEDKRPHPGDTLRRDQVHFEGYTPAG